MPDEVARLNAARRALSLATVVCRAVQQRGPLRLTKDDDSPVTPADFASQAVIARTLFEELGAATIVAEESAAMLRAQLAAGDDRAAAMALDAVRLVWPEATMEDMLSAIDLGAGEPDAGPLRGFWTLDPIDGTKGFLRGEQYSIALAWIEGANPVIGLVACPNLPADLSAPLDVNYEHGTLYYALAGEGLCEAPADDAAARALPIRRLEPAAGEPIRLCESIEISTTNHSESERVLERLGEPAEPVRLDGQTKYAIVARGQADIYLRLPSRRGYIERIWDHAAGSLIAIEGGCAVTDINGRALDFSHGRTLERNRGILAAPPALHGRAIGALRDLSII